LSSYRISIAGREELRHWINGLRCTRKRDLHAAREALGFDRAAFLRDCRPYLTIEQALRLHHDGFTPGAHGCDHSNLAHLPWEQAANGIIELCQFVSDLTGTQRVPFAIPF
jgi:hypothetical protein